MENSTTSSGCGFNNIYQVDMTGIKKPNNVRNDKELEAEISKICEILKDTCKFDEAWIRIHIIFFLLENLCDSFEFD